ncbi:MAG: hypothetical protein HKN97_11875 [Myxococcales bacterium]|nr:hypothetical protein [Myxococcales bacterium]RZV54767.1 MAG: hypothetical protein EX268_04895 [Deltaproteobacteria bacterium]
MDRIEGSSPRHRSALAGLLIFGFALASGCTGVLQNLGARWVTGKIAAVFDLDDEQRMATRAAVDRTIASAPEVLGPRLELLVATVDRALAKGMTEKKVLVIERQVDILMDKAVSWILDEAAPILATLSDEQIDHAERELDERLQETRDELNAPEEERLQSRQEKFIEAIEKWSGRLSDAQEKQIRSFVVSMPDEAPDRLRADEKRLAAIADRMRNHPGAPVIRDLLWTAWTQREDWGPGTRSAEERRADGRKTLLFVFDLLDSKQRDHMSERLHELHEMVKRVMGMDEA